MDKRFLSSALVAGALVGPCLPAVAAHLAAIAVFSGPNGYKPTAGLISDGAGNLYGTTTAGGICCGITGGGVVFKLAAPTIGKAAGLNTALVKFTGPNGFRPTAGLIADRAGNLYGTTTLGGTPAPDWASTLCSGGCGTIFQLTRPASDKATWTETVLFSFDGINGYYPEGGLVADNTGNLYGTTTHGGGSPNCTYGCGTVFKLAPPAAGKTAWTQTVLASFDSADGSYPYSGLIFDNAGNLYGTAGSGGASGKGAVFKVAPPAAGKSAWTETVIASFNGDNGASPSGNLIADSAGNLYGTTSSGGSGNRGVVFKLAPPAAGKKVWRQTVLVRANTVTGDTFQSGLIFDNAGNLYGTASSGGTIGEGTVFKLAPPAKGRKAWTETVLASFNVTNGDTPVGGLIADSAGNLYGTTAYGGASRMDMGVVFKLTP